MNRKQRSLRLVMLGALLIVFRAEAETIVMTYSSGTGFFVSRDGYLLTNLHVVQNCREITIAGPIREASATLAESDREHDLALLKTSAIVSDVANLSNEKQPLRVRDPVVIVGYPGQSWKSLRTVTRPAQIKSTTGPLGEEKWLSFSDALAQGNSGGPLLDSSGNVVGVVAAKGKLYQRNEDAARDELIDNIDLAISLPVIRRFLDDNDVRYQEADSGIYLSTERVRDIGNRFVVNVRCRLD